MSVLIDAIYINNSGGKILLDYLMDKFNKANIDVYYLLDERIRNNHPAIDETKVTYLKASLLKRHKFYQESKNSFKYVFCFGNLPPTVKVSALVYTYFHQPLYLNTPRNLSFKEKLIIKLKTIILGLIKRNSNYWLVQTSYIRDRIIFRYSLSNKSVLQLPFYPPLFGKDKFIRIPNSFVYISNFSSHKNHLLLIEAFCSFYDLHKVGQLTLTIDERNIDFCKFLTGLKSHGYPIFNIGFVKREDLYSIYRSSEYLIYPSLAESFGLGLVEAIDNGCKVIGANLPYTYEVCNPSILFNPQSKEDILVAFEKAIKKEEKATTKVIFNKIDDLIDLFRQNENTK